MLKPDHELLAHLVEQILAEYPDGMAIYRFGSWGTAANQRRDSDIDIALLAARPISAISLWELSQRLAQLGIGKINAFFGEKESTEDPACSQLQ